MKEVRKVIGEGDYDTEETSCSALTKIMCLLTKIVCGTFFWSSW